MTRNNHTISVVTMAIIFALPIALSAKEGVADPTLAFLSGGALATWVALVSGMLLVIFAWHMRGGRIMYPFMLIGLGQLFDGIVNFLPEEGAYLAARPYLDSVFHIAVLVAIIWIGSLFGLIRRR